MTERSGTVTTRFTAELLWVHTMGSTWVIRDNVTGDYVMGGPQDDLRSLKFLTRDDAVAAADQMNAAR